MSLTNPSLDKMIGLIRDSFRMRANTQSTYVDIGDNLARIGAQQHQVIFGRRGSGKSCLLMQYLNTADTKRINSCLYPRRRVQAAYLPGYLDPVTD